MSGDNRRALTVSNPALVYLLTDLSTRPDCRRFSSTPPYRWTFTISITRRRRRPHKGPAAHAAMLEMNNSYVGSFAHRWVAAVRSAAAVCYKRIAVAKLGHDTLWQCCCFRTAPTSFTWTSRRTARRSRSPLWNTTAGNWYVQWQAVPAVGQRCRRLWENGTAAAKIFAL